MRIIQINSTCGIGSTGKIAVGISRLLTQSNADNYIFCSFQSSKYPLGIRFCNKSYTNIQAMQSYFFGNYGFNSVAITKRMVSEIERLNPDIVHLHNIHGHDCNLEILFSYFKERKIKLIWTFHDCWAFTGYCTYFSMNDCNKWKNECEKCTQRSTYSLLFDRSNELFHRKKRLFDGLDMTIVTPSIWLADIVKQSFLKDYPIEVINNGIDLEVFKPISSDFKQKYHIPDKKSIVLGVAFYWDARKGLDFFTALSQRLDKEKYQIVLVGIDKRIERQLPNNIITINRLQSQSELAAIYSSSDVYVNPTREDNYPTVNIESLACGTPVLTFRTGGSPEMLDETCGSVVECGDIDALESEIIRICTDKPYSQEACIRKAKAFDKNERFKEYLKLYERINTAGAEGN